MTRREQLPGAGDQGNDGVVDKRTERRLRQSVKRTQISRTVGVPPPRPRPANLPPLVESDHR